jgi:hypothetical protein
VLNLLKDYKGAVEVNGQSFDSLDSALKGLKNFDGQLTIVLNKGAGERVSRASQQVEEVAGDKIYRIKVRQYMIKPSTPEFDFHDKWNNGIPMPMRIMVGRKLKETKGMVQMELWGEITEEVTTHCMRCGRTLTNPVSKYFGIGPECGNHGYNNPFDDEEELKRAVKEMDKQLREIKWTGWVIKSAIEEETYLENRGLD